MAGAVHEHEKFQTGMMRLKNYLVDVGVDFDSAELIRTMESFKDPLYSHLKGEPAEIVVLAKYSTTEQQIDILPIADAAGCKCKTSSTVLHS